MKSHVVDRDRGWNALAARAKELAVAKSAVVKVGVLSSDAKGQEKHGALTLAELAAVLHFGTRNGRIPPRPFLTMAFDAKRGELKEMGAELLAAVLFGRISLDKALDLMGATLASAARATIVAGVAPPNAPSTIRRKALKAAGVRSALNAASKASARAIGGSDRRLAAAGRATARATQKLAASAAGVKPLIDTGRLLNSITWARVPDGSERH